MAVNRIYYALQNILYYSSTTSTWRTIGAAQSAGITSTVNIENFSSFGTLHTSTQINDADFELSIERLLSTDSSSLFTLIARGSEVAADQLLGFNQLDPDKTVRLALVYTLPSNTPTGSNDRNILMMDCVPASYSMNLGLEGGVTESMTFQNAGNAILTNLDALPGGTISTFSIKSALDNVLTRRDFRRMNFRKAYGGTVTDWLASNVQSVSCSMDFSTEKLNVLGRSLPVAKYATYPIECSMEVEEHMDPSTNIMTPPVEVNQVLSNGEAVSLKNTYFNPQIWIGSSYLSSDTCGAPLVNNATGYAHTWQMGCARMTGRNLSGGDAGGGNVTVQTSFTGYNSLFYSFQTDGTDYSSITTIPPSQQNPFNNDQYYDSLHDDPANVKSTPSPSGNYMRFDTGWNEDAPTPFQD